MTGTSAVQYCIVWYCSTGRKCKKGSKKISFERSRLRFYPRRIGGLSNEWRQYSPRRSRLSSTSVIGSYFRMCLVAVLLVPTLLPRSNLRPLFKLCGGASVLRLHATLHVARVLPRSISMAQNPEALAALAKLNALGQRAALEPDNASVHFEIAALHMSTGAAEAAATAMRESIQLDPSNQIARDAYSSIADALFEDGNYEAAKDCWQRLRADDADPALGERLAAALQRTGQLRQAASRAQVSVEAV